MRKWLIYIYLPVLSALACLQIGFYSIRYNNATSPYNVHSGSNFNPGLNYPDSEFERGGIYHYTANVFTGLQKAMAYLPGNTKFLVNPSRAYSLAAFSKIELFDNDLLSYNYPAHNFW